MYKQIVKNNLSDQIAEYLETRILRNELKVGEKLPGEIELAEKFGASRNVLREALAALKDRGLIAVKNGSGIFVAQPNSVALSKVVNRLVRIGDVAPNEIYEIRLALEVDACGLAAKRATDDDIACLKSIIKQMEDAYTDDDQWSNYDYEFHQKIAYMTYNKLYPIILEPLSECVGNIRSIAPPPMEARMSGIKNHRDIVAAIEAHDQKAARKAMVTHLKRFLMDLMLNNKFAPSEE